MRLLYWLSFVLGVTAVHGAVIEERDDHSKAKSKKLCRPRSSFTSHPPPSSLAPISHSSPASLKAYPSSVVSSKPRSSKPVTSSPSSIAPISHSSPPSSKSYPSSRVSSKPSSSKPVSSFPSFTPCVNSPTNRQCWGDYDINTNYYQVIPDTGVTREYWFTVDNVTMAPDGFERQMLVVNGQYPGPTVEANWGDWVVVHVQNNLKDNGTAIHWHGVLQTNNGANDGVPGVSQCPIPPGSSFTYRFRANSYGTSWYHSHFSLQYSDGVLGPIVVYGPSSANWDVDLGPLTLTDWFHITAFEQFFTERIPGPPNPAPNGLIGGKNKFNGSGSYTELTFEPGKKYRIRLINTSTNTHFKFWLDEHVMTVQGADFIAMEPYNTTVLDIAIGQRYDIIFEANQAVDNYWIHALPATQCSANDNQNGILAIVRYDGADTTADPTSTPYIPSNTNCQDESSLVPVVPRNVGTLSFGEDLNVTLTSPNNIVKWTINNSSFQTNYSDPTLLMIDDHNPNYPGSFNVISLTGTEETWVYFVVESGLPIVVPHPIHLHGHDFLVIASGTGTYNDSVLQTANYINPVRRDVATLPAPSAFGATGGYLVIAFPLDNPGTWLMHCHIAWHVSEGLALQFVERVDAIPGNVGVTAQWQENCKAWQQYQAAINPPQDDSGV